MPKFNKGDLVVLKSGGPPMTIDALPGERVPGGHGQRDTEYHVRWFKGASSEWGWFGEHLLDTFVPPAKK